MYKPTFLKPPTQAQASRNAREQSGQLSICRLTPCFQTRLRYAEHYVATQLKSENIRTTFVTTDHVLNSLKHIVPYEQPGIYWDDEFSWVRLKSIAIGQKPIVSLDSLKSIVRSHRFDAFHLSGVGVPLTLQFLLAHRVCQSHKPIIISDHTTPETSIHKGAMQRNYYRVLRLALRQLKERINRVVSFCPQSCELLASRFGISRSKFQVIPLGYDAEVFQFLPTDSPIDPARFTISFAGKLSHSKRIDVLIRALSNVKDKESIELQVAGLADCEAELRNDLLNLAETHNVRLKALPLLDARTLAQFYNNSDLAVFPGSISITTLEASGCGTPVIIYRSIDGIESRVDNGRGHLFETPSQLVSLIQSAKDNRETCESRRQRAKATETEFSWHNLAVLYSTLYAELLVD
ncbi:MAG: glycosyltransferase family 4 protein [Pirellulaceae bacterium]|nr:glycosyltransferase family 4 protein [Pirellulaceae bacterium]